MKRWIVLALIANMALPSVAMAGAREQARRMHDRLTGVPPSDAMLDRMTDAIVGGDAIAATEFAMDGAPADGGDPAIAANGNFYNVIVKNWATPWTNQYFNVFAPLNDYTATVIGMVRDSDSGVDFRDLLSGDIIYVGNAGAVSGIPAYSNSNNNHYEFLEASAANMGDSNVLEQRSQTATTNTPLAGVAGVQTTRAAARAFFIDGTNRAMFRYTLVNHLCMDLEQLKDTSRPSDRIRQDISRSPGLDSTLFLNQCVGCHSGMDPMAQAYAYHQYDYPSAEESNLSQEEREELGQMVYTSGSVQGKYLINSGNFIHGYVTPNDHWTNYWRLGVNSERIGWLNPVTNTGAVDLAINPDFSEGDGASTLGAELAHTEAFASCQVKKVFRNICGREPASADSADIVSIANNFKTTGNIKRVFSEAAVTCSNHL